MRRAALLAVLCLLAAHAAATAGEVALDAEWTPSIGAQGAAEGPSSRFERADDGAIALEGDAATKLWTYVARGFRVSGRGYRLRFRARATGLRDDPGQFQSCYVGLVFYDERGGRLARQVADVRAPEWTPGEIVRAPPPGAARGEVAAFLSKTGRLEVRDVALEALGPEASFDLLAADMGRHYSYFAHRGIDWEALVARYRERGAAAARDPEAFIAVAKAMLAELCDAHVWIVPPGGGKIPTYRPEPPANFDYRVVAEKLASARRIGKVALVGRTQEGFAYAAIASLEGDDATFAEVERAIEGLLDAPGFLLDLRGNAGGNELRAQRIAAFFADERRVYARAQVRSGPAPTDLVEVAPRAIEPRPGGRPYTRPIVCLIGPRCVSSGEGFAKMICALPHATLVGQPTRGASGNPHPVHLPNGVSVWYSRWVDMLPDGTVFEGKGIPPAIPIAHEGPGDPTFDAAVAELARRVGEGRAARDQGTKEEGGAGR